MRFGQTLRDCAALFAQSEHRSAYVDYNGLKKWAVPTMSSTDFTSLLDAETSRLNEYAASCVAALEAAATCEAAAAATCEATGFAKHSLLSLRIGALLAFIHYNRTGLRKIGKKYDKVSATLDETESHEAFVLRRIGQADFTTHSQRLQAIQQTILSECEEDKRHLLVHALQSAASPDLQACSQRAQVDRLLLSPQSKLIHKRLASPSPRRSRLCFEQSSDEIIDPTIVQLRSPAEL